MIKRVKRRLFILKWRWKIDVGKSADRNAGRLKEILQNMTMQIVLSVGKLPMKLK